MTNVYADFRNLDTKLRVRLTHHRTIKDVVDQGLELHPGDVVTLYDDKIPGVDGVIALTEEGEWVAIVNWHQVGEVVV